MLCEEPMSESQLSLLKTAVLSVLNVFVAFNVVGQEQASPIGAALIAVFTLAAGLLIKPIK
ncbi:hypothetical protein EBR66_07220 [bacterium]|nr:hypothetical protein [bacterium]